MTDRILVLNTGSSSIEDAGRGPLASAMGVSPARECPPGRERALTER
ncbi:MAG: hypothetical protein K0R62_2569, partial [Nonomuraea muscovyensis]|nr:hypothetical protein [Nonomuraea muscovyensis]